MKRKRQRQEWHVGGTVKVGFLTFLVTGFEPTPGDYKPDIWHLQDGQGRSYTYTPYWGLERKA